MKRNEANNDEREGSVTTCNSAQKHFVRAEKVSTEELSATHDVSKVDSETQLKELAQTLSAAIEIQLEASQLGNSYPEALSSSNDTLNAICNYRSEFEVAFSGFFDLKIEDQRWMINALHKHIVGNESITNFQKSSSRLSKEAIALYCNHPIRSQLLSLSHVFIIPLFTGNGERSFDSNALFKVWINQIVGLTCDTAAELCDSQSSFCIDCLSKEPFFKRIRKVVRDFVKEQTKRTLHNCKEPVATQKRLLKNLDLLVADITEGTFFELATEFGEFRGDYIELRRPIETEIN